eukprot:GHVL01037674.1.p1 GENE.GHVL01037674.1~~GHVL01037674.1.p1  ORF type:complete len:380 (+),score=75.93 GHVL01037674.1:50-1189(+)
MNFDFSISSALGVYASEGVEIVDSKKLLIAINSAMKANSIAHSRNPPVPTHGDRLTMIIDRMGAASAKSQGLKVMITSAQRLIGTDHRVYLKYKDHRCLGLLKVGRKKLFLRDRKGSMVSCEPLCVLDFYVPEECQRSGNGKIVFDRMLTVERHLPLELGYDRPSSKFLAFLSKYFKLTQYCPQANNFVVFDEFFSHGCVPNQNRSGYITSRAAHQTLSDDVRWRHETARNETARCETDRNETDRNESVRHETVRCETNRNDTARFETDNDIYSSINDYKRNIAKNNDSINNNIYRNIYNINKKQIESTNNLHIHKDIHKDSENNKFVGGSVFSRGSSANIFGQSNNHRSTASLCSGGSMSSFRDARPAGVSSAFKNRR